MNPRFDSTAQVALVAQVAGAGSGTGLATARAFAASGASVVLGDIDEKALRRAPEGIDGGFVADRAAPRHRRTEA